MFKTTDKGVEMQKFVEIQGKQENQPPLQEATVRNNEQPPRENENVEREEEHDEQQNRQPLREIPLQNSSIRRPTRPHRPSQRYPRSQYILLTDEGEPSCFQEACEGENNIKWQKGM